jgi:hypothetical protein
MILFNVYVTIIFLFVKFAVAREERLLVMIQRVISSMRTNHTWFLLNKNNLHQVEEVLAKKD